MEAGKEFKTLNDGTTAYDILGEEFEVTSQQAAYLKWTIRRHEKAEQGKEEGKRVYRQLGNLNAYMTRLPMMLEKWRDQVFDDTVDYLMSYEIYEYDRRRLMKKARELEDYFIEDYGEKTGTLMAHAAEEPDYHISQMKEVISDILKQGNKPKENKALSASLYQDEAIKNSVIASYAAICTTANIVALSVLLENGAADVYDTQSDKADAICENCKRSTAFNREQQRKMLSQAFIADPLNTKVIETAMRLGLDDSGGLAEFAEHFGLLASNPASQSRGELSQAGGDAVKTLCNKFLLSHNASLFQCTPKLKAALGIADMDDSDIYLARDDTVLKSGKNGFAITKSGIYCRDVAAKPTHVSFEMLACASKFTKKLSGGIYADKTFIAQSSECGKDLVQLFTDIAKAVR